ncbi:T9SS type A sorting domain-containing protein [Rubricoccus marinus]|uniref:Secretion system C-terminal sorting domain-containing protein n=1 Tax=Rubricoccus marinus TaxID=716817 RepID=A0A259TVM6_9BACT|nr:T9SS type A sorting domain-containing protein [Rubricoccus marinus]OZC01756.1 hypothetical protein BSZ36_01390 [Rubricoccus marinus]
MRLLLVLFAMVLASGAAAQPEVTWERVGDRPHDTVFPLSVGPDGFLWSAFNEVEAVSGGQVFYQGLYRLAPPYDSATLWEKVSAPVRGSSRWAHVVSRDTILLDEGNRTYRSTDGAGSWQQIQDVNGVTRIIEMPAGLPHAGRLIAARGGQVASFSDDRGATWTPADLSGLTNGYAERIAVVTTGAHAGRLVAGGLSGIIASDDGGYTWHTTSEWAFRQQSTNCIATLRGQSPSGGDRVLTVVNDIRIPDDSVRVSVSDDGGETWQRGAGLFPGDFRTCMEVVDLGGGRAAAVMMRGPVWWTEDAGETWARWAEWEELVAPREVVGGDPRAFWALAGPDGRLYIGLSTPGGDKYVYDKRTSEPVTAWPVAGEPAPREASGARLRVSPNPASGAVRIALELGTPEAVAVTVYDARGREVYREASGARGDHAWEVDTRAWAAGVYAVRAEVGGEVVSARLAVAR